MKDLVSALVKFAQTLPGFGLAFLTVTLVHQYLKGSAKELSTTETLITAGFCWALYHVASLLDRIYDRTYGHKSTLHLWRFDKLKDARDRAAVALFSRLDRRVTDYVSADKWQHVTSTNSLYRQCSKVAAQTEAWKKRISPTIHVSKAARTIFAFALVGMIAPHFAVLRAWPDIDAYVSQLRPVTVTVRLGLTAVAAFLVYVVLRLRHNIELYEYVAEHVKHRRLRRKQAAAVIYDVIVTDRRP